MSMESAEYGGRGRKVVRRVLDVRQDVSIWRDSIVVWGQGKEGCISII